MDNISQRGFWDGILAGGLLGAALTAMYMASDEQERNVKRVTGRLSRTRQMMQDLGNEVASAWKK